MAVARTNGAFVGTNETTGATIAAGASEVGSQVDLLGDDTSFGEVQVFLIFTPAAVVTQGNVRVVLYDIWANAGNKYVKKDGIINVNATGAAASQQKINLGRFKACRYGSGTVTNNTDKSLGTVALLYQREKVS